MLEDRREGRARSQAQLSPGSEEAFAHHPILDQVETTTGKRPERAFCDRGFRGKSAVGGTKIEIANVPGKDSTAHHKRKAKAKFRRRSAIEAVISHVKHDFRMLRNYLKGTAGDTINLLLAAAAFNFKKWMRATALVFFALFSFQKFILVLRTEARSKALAAA